MFDVPVPLNNAVDALKTEFQKQIDVILAETDVSGLSIAKWEFIKQMDAILEDLKHQINAIASNKFNAAWALGKEMKKE